MARDISPKCKQCRSEGEKLFLKGDRCYSVKCAIIKRKYPGGIHGPKGYPRQSEYALQLREKQKIKRFYGILEKQLRKYYEAAKKHIGNTEVLLLSSLERRLDNVIYRAGLSASRQGARQLINHGHILVNNKKVDIPSYQVKTGDSISLRENNKLSRQIKEILADSKTKSELPKWFTFDKKKTEIKIINLPTPEDLPQEFNVRLVVEFYSR